jgi:hypothetical protein
MDYNNDSSEKQGSDVEAIEPGTMSPIDLEEGNGKLHAKLKGRHMQMIAIGGSIGAGLFVGSGGSLASGGPGSLVIDFIITGFMLLLTVNALGELAGEPTAKTPPITDHSKICSSLSRCWILLQLLRTFYRPCLGICHGMELRHKLARRITFRTDHGWDYYRVLCVWIRPLKTSLD